MKRYATIAALLVTAALPLASAASAAPQPPDSYNGAYVGSQYIQTPAYRGFGREDQVVVRGNNVSQRCVGGFDSDLLSAYPAWERCR